MTFQTSNDQSIWKIYAFYSNLCSSLKFKNFRKLSATALTIHLIFASLHVILI
ncbi:unnamed protein product [Tenebrio molitor]|nr:unnamed protein product [Tenebrio molitor]